MLALIFKILLFYFFFRVVSAFISILIKTWQIHRKMNSNSAPRQAKSRPKPESYKEKPVIVDAEFEEM